MLTHSRSIDHGPERVVVLGRRGFIGATLANTLAQRGQPALGVSLAEVDLIAADGADRLAAMLRSTDSLVVLSALTPNKGRGAEAMLTNLHMGQAVCGALAKQPVDHVVYVSSDAVYPMTGAVLTEQSPAAPTDLYGVMHLARELMFKAAVGDRLAVVRPTMVYGAGDTHNAYGPNRFRRQAKAAGKIVLGGGGEETRDHILVEDVAVLMALVCARRSLGALNLVSGRSISFDRLARKIAALFEQSVQVVHTERSTPVTHRHFDALAIRKAFPEFRPTPLNTGLQNAQSEG